MYYRKKLVLAFDVGTTFSGISYSIFEQDDRPEVRGVTRFPADEHSNGKIPSVIYYDQQGNVRAVGAETTRESIYDTAQDEGWIKAEWFKLHLSPETDAAKLVKDQLPPLPLNKSIVDVLADFLKYLFRCASSYIKGAHVNGRDLWRFIEEDISFVLAHPNGWGGFQKSQMGQAAVLAGLIPDTKKGHARITFVTEGEASLHFAIQNGLAVEHMKEGDGIVVVDAGGGTIDVSAFSQDATLHQDEFKEIGIAESHFHGSIFVSIHARAFLDNYLADSTFINDLDHIVSCFDTTTKLRFQSDDGPEYIKFGFRRDNDYAHGIRFGQVKLDGSDIREFFRPSVKCIIDAVVEQWKSAHVKVTHVVLVGGFAANDWLCNEVHKVFKLLRIDIVRPENGVNKAVSDGAIFFYFKNSVQHRDGVIISEETEAEKAILWNDGKSRAECLVLPFYASLDPEVPTKCSPRQITRLLGRIMIPKRFGSHVCALGRMRPPEKDSKEVRLRFRHESKVEISSITVMLSRYYREPPFPQWPDVKTRTYQDFGSTTIPLGNARYQSLQRKVSGQQGTYYQVDWEIIMFLSLSEVLLEYGWVEDGVQKRYSDLFITEIGSDLDGRTHLATISAP